MSAYQLLKSWMAVIAIPATPINKAIQEIISARLDRISEFLAFSTSALVSSTCSLANSIFGSGGMLIAFGGFIKSLMSSAFFAYSSVKRFMDSFSIAYFLDLAKEEGV